MDAAEIAFDSFEKQNCQRCFKHGCLKQRILRVKKVGSSSHKMIRLILWTCGG